jgi:signal transduction histidine kinase
MAKVEKFCYEQGDQRMGRKNNFARQIQLESFFGFLLCAAFLSVEPAGAIENTGGLSRSTNSPAFWIWDRKTTDKQTCRLWRAFEIPQSAVIARAQLQITADNGYRVLLDGREVGKGSDWRTLTIYDLTWLLEPAKKHVLAVEAFNDNDKAGVFVKLAVEMTDDRVLEINSDRSWMVVPSAERDWEKKLQPSADWTVATTVGAFGQLPWWQKPNNVIKVPPLRPIAIHFWQRAWFQITLLSICVVVVSVCLRLMAKLTLQSRAQQLLQRERARIARDIHDDLGARLTQLVLQGEVLRSELPSNSGMREQINQLCERVRDVLAAIDEIVWVVNSKRDTLRDFSTYVCKYAQLFLGSTSIRSRFDIESEMPSIHLDLPIRRNLFLAVKEALNNAAKHSGATEIFLRIHREKQSLRVVIEDNGRGFAVADARAERNGLMNMAQRMSEVGGEFNVTSTPGSGAKIEFKLPLTDAKQRPRFLKWFRRRSERLGPEAQEKIARDELERLPGTINS